MKTTIKIIAQEIDSKTGEVINQHLVFEKDVILPKKIHDLGFTHLEQIEILRQSQETMLHAQQIKINEQNVICPECGKKTNKQGTFKSDFHAVFTDHKILFQRKRCTCGFTSKISVDGTYGSALHPDLVEMQALLGAENSFQRTADYLEKKCCHKRSINNHSRIQKTVNQVGRLLCEIKKDKKWAYNATKTGIVSDELVLVIDGAHIGSNDADKPAFEALTATVFDPKNLVEKDKNHNTILSKTVVVSVKNDKQKSIKLFTKNACIKQGMTKNTKLIVITDGAKNCWSIVSDIESEHKNMTKILDWFHIGKKFKNFEHHISEQMKDEYEKAKWCLWHGNANKSLLKLHGIKSILPAESKNSLTPLITYITNNKSHIINYQERQKSGQAFTSQLAESTVNNLVNVRQKHDKRMQWSREGADAVLQIRSSKQSRDWNKDWDMAQLRIYREAA